MLGLSTRKYGQDGRKMILGLRQGATENATVVGELLAELVDRGLDFALRYEAERLSGVIGQSNPKIALSRVVWKWNGKTACAMWSVLKRSYGEKSNSNQAGLARISCAAFRRSARPRRFWA